MNHGFELFYISNKNEKLSWLVIKKGSFHKNNHFFMAIPINCNCFSKIETIKAFHYAYTLRSVVVLIIYFISKKFYKPKKLLHDLT